MRIANRLFGDEELHLRSRLRGSGQGRARRAARRARLQGRRGGRPEAHQRLGPRRDGEAHQGSDPEQQGVDGDTRLVLTNAIYFRGEWEEPFQKAMTRPEPFHPTPAESKTVPTPCTAPSTSASPRTDEVKVLDQPYQGGDLTMTLVLPNADTRRAGAADRRRPRSTGGSRRSTRCRCRWPCRGSRSILPRRCHWPRR